MKKILLVRHGQASFGKDHYDKLSDLGIEQAHLLGQYFSKHNINIDKIITGTLIRQQDSAKHFAKKFLLDSGRSLPAQIINDFNEFNHQQILLKYTNFDNLSDLKANLPTEEPIKHLVELFAQAMIRWHSGDYNEDEYDESWSQFYCRANNALRQVIDETEDGNTILVFTSGGVIASIISNLLNFANETQASTFAYSMNRQLINTGVTTISVNDSNNLNDEKVQLLTINACEHLLNIDKDHLSWY